MLSLFLYPLWASKRPCRDTTSSLTVDHMNPLAFSALRTLALSGMNRVLAAVVFALAMTPFVVDMVRFPSLTYMACGMQAQFTSVASNPPQSYRGEHPSGGMCRGRECHRPPESHVSKYHQLIYVPDYLTSTASCTFYSDWFRTH